MLPGMERTCQKDKILTFCEVRLAPGMPRSMLTGKLAKAKMNQIGNLSFMLLDGEAHLTERQILDFLGGALSLEVHKNWKISSKQVTLNSRNKPKAKLSSQG